MKAPQMLCAIVDGQSTDVRVSVTGEVSVVVDGRKEAVQIVEADVGGEAARAFKVSPLADAAGAETTDRPLGSRVAFVDEVAWVFVEGEVFEVELVEAQREPSRRRDRAAHDALAAPMPATVTRILVDAGQQVAHGDTLVILEAMKMEMPIKAPHDGRVVRIRCRPGELVQPGEPLVELQSAP